MKHLWNVGLAALVLALAGGHGKAQIKAFTLEEMLDTADSGVYGTVIAKNVFRVDHPTDGPELYFTRITIDGRTLADDLPITVDVVFHGGFATPTEGVWNSEAPAADDYRYGSNVVAFYRWTPDMGGGVAANALVAAHGGLFRTVDAPGGVTVLGRGEGYAVSHNVKLTSLCEAVRGIKKR